MKVIPIKIRRIFAYLVQLLLIICVFLILKMIIGHAIALVLEKYFLHFNFSGLNDISLSKNTILNLASNINITNFIVFYKKFLLSIIIYSVVVYTIVPLLVKLIFYTIGDIGKLIFGLEVYGKEEKASKHRSVSTSPAYKSFKMLYVILLFVTITIPVFQSFPVDKLPKSIHLFITFIYLISIIQIIIYIIILLSFAVRFIINKDTWRKKKGLEVRNRGDEPLHAQNLDGQINSLKQNNVQNTDIQIRYPNIYNFMIKKNYKLEHYLYLDEKTEESEKIKTILSQIENEQIQNPDYMIANEEKIIKLINLLFTNV